MGAISETKTMPFGPYQGQAMTDLSTRYLRWIVADVSANEFPELVAAAKDELKLRKEFSDATTVTL